jgi:pimeloyl-ACP methyl ester carboxylesterase
VTQRSLGKAHPLGWAFLVLGLLSLAGCGDRSPFLDNEQVAERIAARGALQRADIRAGAFNLRSYRRFAAPAARTLTVYIEGDGSGWQFGVQQPDPTPESPTALALAAADDASNRLYLARPCQYEPAPVPARCHPAFWSTHRYAEEVIAAMSAAIDQAARTLGQPRIRLVGFSGGGPTAALIAARRTDVGQLVTVAGNLDHREWTRMFKVTPLDGSLYPPDYAATLQRIPQVHFSGMRDDIVPKAVLDAYVRQLPDRSRVRVVDVPRADHDCCWRDLWPSLLKSHLAEPF